MGHVLVQTEIPGFHLTLFTKVDTVQAPRRCDGYLPQHCDNTRMWLHPFFKNDYRLKHMSR